MEKKKYLLILMVFSLYGPKVFSQPITDFGKLSAYELEMQFYEKDKDAEAVVLYDLGEIEFQWNPQGGYDVVYERRTKIKIFTDAGLEWGKISIPLYRKGNIYETLQEVQAVTYRIEGRIYEVIKLDPKSQYTEKVNNYYDLVKFAIPGVKAGCIIEYKYKTRSQYKFQLNDWEFQWRIPVKYSELKAKMIPFYSYVFLLQGTNKFDVRESYEERSIDQHYGAVTFHDVVHVFALNEIPAFHDEGFISSYDDYVIKMGFQLQKITGPTGVETEYLTSWGGLKNELLKMPEFGKYIKASIKKGSKIVEGMDWKGKTQEEKIKEIIDYVKVSYKWNGKRRYVSQQKLKDFLNSKTGNTAEINLYLTGLLVAAGFDATPVIISTRDHGRIHYDYPFVNFFNNVIVKVDYKDKAMLVDGTSRLYAYNDIPLYCINEKGLIINDGPVQWIDLSIPRNKSVLGKYFTINFDNELQKMDCHFKLHATGYKAVRQKSNYLNGESVFKEDMEEKKYQNIDSIKFNNEDNPDLPYIITCNLEYSTEYIDGKWYISPFLNEPPTENMFKQSVRQNPIDIVYAFSQEYHSEIIIPNGYKISYRPKDNEIDNSLVNMIYSIKQEDNRLMIDAGYTFKGVVYKKEAYGFLKYFYGEVIKQFNDKIVLEEVGVE